MIEKHPSQTVYHIGRSTIQHTHPDLLRPEAIRAALIKGGVAPAADRIVHLTNSRHERPVMTMIHESRLGLPGRQPADLREALIALRLDNDEASDEHRDGFQLCRIMVLELLDLLEATGRAQGGAA